MWFQPRKCLDRFQHPACRNDSPVTLLQARTPSFKHCHRRCRMALCDQIECTKKSTIKNHTKKPKKKNLLLTNFGCRLRVRAPTCHVGVQHAVVSCGHGFCVHLCMKTAPHSSPNDKRKGRSKFSATTMKERPTLLDSAMQKSTRAGCAAVCGANTRACVSFPSNSPVGWDVYRYPQKLGTEQLVSFIR